MGHYRSEMIGGEESQADGRFHEALGIRGKLNNVPLSSLTFGELRFLLDLFEFKYGYKVNREQLKHLRKIAKKTGAM